MQVSVNTVGEEEPPPRNPRRPGKAKVERPVLGATISLVSSLTQEARSRAIPRIPRYTRGSRSGPPSGFATKSDGRGTSP